jgi:hypothetical protein
MQQFSKMWNMAGNRENGGKSAEMGKLRVFGHGDGIGGGEQSDGLISAENVKRANVLVAGCAEQPPPVARIEQLLNCIRMLTPIGLADFQSDFADLFLLDHD